MLDNQTIQRRVRREMRMTTTDRTNGSVGGSGGSGTSKPAADRIEIWDIERLIPSARNARTHSEAQIAEIAGSILAFGFMVPVLIDTDGRIIAGHGRVLAARKLNLNRVPV